LGAFIEEIRQGALAAGGVVGLHQIVLDFVAVNCGLWHRCCDHRQRTGSSREVVSAGAQN